MIARTASRERVSETVARHLLDTGLAETSLRQLAKAASISDRMLLYYFRDKADALAAAMAKIAETLSQRLAEAIPAGTRLAAPALVERAARITTHPEVAPYMRLWIEVVAASARGEAPFPNLAQQIAEGFLTWIESRLDITGEDDPRAVAAAILAMIDGLAVLGLCADADLVGRAAAKTARLF